MELPELAVVARFNQLGEESDEGEEKHTFPCARAACLREIALKFLPTTITKFSVLPALAR